jgi:hypothetical protein
MSLLGFDARLVFPAEKVERLFRRSSQLSFHHQDSSSGDMIEPLKNSQHLPNLENSLGPRSQLVRDRANNVLCNN